MILAHILDQSSYNELLQFATALFITNCVNVVLNCKNL